ncbi:8-amino-7-oxononanoate synthase [Catenovulum agarivorans DS-2]|uniref:8-amino-7-oxononanoate synthase n=1 Tax=Catenovulum agarivorans DS-2 TaxID=1328313 RepID=W7QI62_9ALTE|nr:8-amino-7-oxononanoate synthase [Catenovulum agarivorans]EWH08597.1 8-amino-7-oxononanoate synthase [Catenovulum agarivorans DS-2]
MLPSYIEQELAAKQAQYAYRQKNTVTTDQQFIVHNQQKYLNFSGNDYLGIAASGCLQSAWMNALETNLSGSTGSPLINGHHAAHQALEDEICDWLGFDACLLFNSGFSANSSVLKTLLKEQNQLIIQDKLNHASLIDGGLQSAAKNLRFKHNDIEHLQQRLQTPADYKLVVTEGVFSMDGDGAPLQPICQLIAEQDNTGLMLDDAHGIGVFGEQGQGSLAKQNISANNIDIFTATFGKAIGTSGAFVAGSKQLIDYLVNEARAYIFSTSFSPILAEVTRQAIIKIRRENWRREKLEQNVVYFVDGVNKLGISLSCGGSVSAIKPVVIGSNEDTLKLAKILRKQGIWATAIRPPTVPKGQARIRFTINSLHDIADIDQAIQALEIGLLTLSTSQS